MNVLNFIEDILCYLGSSAQSYWRIAFIEKGEIWYVGSSHKAKILGKFEISILFLKYPLLPVKVEKIYGICCILYVYKAKVQLPSSLRRLMISLNMMFSYLNFWTPSYWFFEKVIHTKVLRSFKATSFLDHHWWFC